MMEHEENSLEPIVLPEVVQIGVVVKNLESAMEYYSRHFGLGPWITRVTEHKPFAIVRGEKTLYTCKLAFTSLPPLQLELIEVTKGPSIQLDHLESKGEGIHHLQFRVQNINREIERYRSHGFKVLQEHHTSQGGFAYMDTDKVGGIIFELVGPSPDDEKASLADKKG